MTKESFAGIQDVSLAIVFVSNGPGELSTWVRPLAENLHQRLLMQPRSSASPLALRLILVPCPNATGQEAEVAQKWKQFEKIHKANSFWKLLLRPGLHDSWPENGIVVFLGGDQFWSVLLSARLGYSHITYAEWVARWPLWNDRIAAMTLDVKNKLPIRYRDRCSVVGDLMADLSVSARVKAPLPKGQWVALLPGSKSAKLCIGVPFFLEVADHLSLIRDECRFLLLLAPTTNVHELQYFGSSKNPITNQYNSVIEKFLPAEKEGSFGKIITSAGTEIYLQEEHPAYESLSQCDFALTTVGANTAELGALGIPMIVIVPTQHLHVMQAWDGLLGVFGRIPGLRWLFGFLLSAWRLRNHGHLAWPNISAGRMIVPERVGAISPKEIAEEAAEWLSSPERLQGQREDLRALRGRPGAVEAMSREVRALLPKALGFK